MTLAEQIKFITAKGEKPRMTFRQLAQESQTTEVSLHSWKSEKCECQMTWVRDKIDEIYSRIARERNSRKESSCFSA